MHAPFRCRALCCRPDYRCTQQGQPCAPAQQQLRPKLRVTEVARCQQQRGGLAGWLARWTRCHATLLSGNHERLPTCQSAPLAPAPLTPLLPLPPTTRLPASLLLLLLLQVRVGIFSLRDILPGEELTYDYQFQHFGLAAAAGAYRCKCGAPNCRGTMDTQPERTRVGESVGWWVQLQFQRWKQCWHTCLHAPASCQRRECSKAAHAALSSCHSSPPSTPPDTCLQDYGRRVDVWWPGDRRYFRGTITAYSSSQQRHVIKYDDGDVGRLFLPAEKYRWAGLGWPRGRRQGP